MCSITVDLFTRAMWKESYWTMIKVVRVIKKHGDL